MTSRSTTPGTRASLPTEEFNGARSKHREDDPESGIPWLGRVPSHWQIEKLKYIARAQFSNVNKKTEEGEQQVRLCNYVDVYYHDRITADIEFMEATAEPREIAKFQLQMGDVLITKDSEDPNDICVPAVVAEPLPGVLCGYHLAQVRPAPDRTHGPYLMYAFRSSGIRDQFRMRANGITRFGLSQDDICSALFPLPPLSEQQAIAGWLDERTRRIDDLVAAKRRLIGLLAEQRTALISHAVTKGLEPRAPMKPSGIDWLGDVPGHWEVKRLKFAAMFQRGHDLPLNDRVDGDVPVVTSSGPSAWHNQSITHGPAIVTGRYGTVGDFYLVDGPYWPLNTALYTIDLYGNDARFLWYMLHTLRDIFLMEAGKSAVPGVDRNDLHPIPVVVPPLAEQHEIARFLDARCRGANGLDALTAATESAIARLTEYRQALISAAVTGKINVTTLPNHAASHRSHSP